MMRFDPMVPTSTPTLYALSSLARNAESTQFLREERRRNAVNGGKTLLTPMVLSSLRCCFVDRELGSILAAAPFHNNWIY